MKFKKTIYSADKTAGKMIFQIDGKMIHVGFSMTEGDLLVMYPSAYGCGAVCPMCSSSKKKDTFFLNSNQIVELIQSISSLVEVVPNCISNEGGGEPLIDSNRVTVVSTLTSLRKNWPNSQILISSIFPEGVLSSLGEQLIAISTELQYDLQVSMHSFTTRRSKLITGQPLESLDKLSEFAEKWKHSTGRNLIANMIATPQLHQELQGGDDIPVNPDTWSIRLSPLFLKDGKMTSAQLVTDIEHVFLSRGFSVLKNIPSDAALSIGAVPGFVN